MIEQQYNGDSQDFADACLEWDVERLVKDLEEFEKRLLTPAEKRNLQAILLGLSASQAQDRIKVAKKTRSLDGYFNKIRRIVELFLDLESSTLKTSHDVVNALASYRKGQELPPPKPEFDLLGRDTDRKKLAELSQKHKLVLLKAAAGIGKSTLARHFLETQFTKVIRLEMGLEAGNVTPAEEKVSQILRKEFDEEPSRDFQTNLEILREKLSDKSRPIGVLIDNLEPALDGNFRFLEKLRGYEDLLRILGDRDVCSFTLITSRLDLIVQRVNVHQYLLQGLDIEAWREYFHDCENRVTSEALEQMCDAYNGNAKAMDILHGAITNRFDGNIAAYWSRYKDTLLADSELETLISLEMDWLRDNQPYAYKLLCRMGCYRYQDVKTVPFEGLICLLWDVPESKRIGFIDYLSRTSLIEVKGEYYLHPAIRESAKSRLMDNQLDWETTNCNAASFWSKSFQIIETIKDALGAFEAYHHYVSVRKFDQAAEVIITSRSSQHGKYEHLGRTFRRLGLLNFMTCSISNILTSISSDFIFISQIYNILGDHYWLIGNISKAIECHELSGISAEKFLIDIQNHKSIKADENLRLLKYLKINSLFNIGLCKMDLWEIMESLDFFSRASSQVHEELTKSPDNLPIGYEVDFLSSQALLRSVLGQTDKSLDCINMAIQKIEIQYINFDSWSKGYNLLFLGQAYKNLLKVNDASKIYHQVISYAEESHYMQVKSRALTGLAELGRIQKDFKTAICYHLESIKLLNKIGAKCDLAEACFQLGLTYQAMGEHDQAETYKVKALELFEEMEAPRQIERVNQAFEQGAKQ